MSLTALRLPLRRISTLHGFVRCVGRNTLKRASSNFMPSFVSEIRSESKYLLLSEDHYDFIDAERRLLGDLHRVLHKLDGDKEDLDLVHDLRSRIDDLFMVVVVGEFNAGKSTFINSLLGDKYLKSGVLPTTDRICLLRSDKESSDMTEFVKEAGSAHSKQWKRSDHLMLEDVEELEVKSADWLQPGVALVDTPGTNALMSRHDYLSKVIVPRADLILFITSAERPMSESECAFLSRIADWGKKVVICLNKKDVVSEDEIKEVEDYVKLSAASRLQYTSGKVPVFSVSSIRALEAKLAAKEGTSTSQGSVQRLYESSGIEALENYLASTLGREEVLFNKLAAPLTVTDRLVARAMEDLLAQEDALLTDKRTLDMVHESMNSYQEDLSRDTEYLREKAAALFTGVKAHIDDYVRDSVCISKVGQAWATTLFGHSEEVEASSDAAAVSKSTPESRFLRSLQQRTQEDLEPALMEAVRDVAELMAQRNRSQASSVVQYVMASKLSRETGNSGARVTEVSSGQWEVARLELVARLERQSKSVLTDKGVTDEDICWAWGQAKQSLYASQVLGLVGASGVFSAAFLPEILPGGPVPGAILGTVSTLIAASGSLFILSRKKIISRFAERMDASRIALDSTLKQTFEHELRTSTELIRSSISPFARYVKHEAEKVRGLQEELTQVRERAREMQRDLHRGAESL